MEVQADASVVAVPSAVRVMLGRAAVQVIADAAGVDLLHIKGEVVDVRLNPTPVPGSDIDALVRPEHVKRLDEALRRHGWKLYSSFAYGSPFEHAQTYLHDLWGYFDLHRLFPGVYRSPDEAFDLMWHGRQRIHLAGADGFVPGVTMQATVLVLNSARSGQLDALGKWVRDPGLDQRDIDRHVRDLHAQVAYAAATGRLAEFRHEPEYLLWRTVTTGGSRAAEWWGRIRAARSPGDRIRIALRAPLVNTEQLSHVLGRQPSRIDVAAALVRRGGEAVRELCALRRKGRDGDKT